MTQSGHLSFADVAEKNQVSKRVAVGAGVTLIAFGLAGAVMYVGTPWSYLGILAAASGGAIIGSWLRNIKTD